VSGMYSVYLLFNSYSHYITTCRIWTE